MGRIRTRATFRALARPDGRGRHGPVSVAFSRVPESTRLPLVAYAIGRRHGDAVARNRLRRRLREAVRAAGPALEPGAYLVRATPGDAELGFAALCRAVGAAAAAAARRAPGSEERK
ncbi:MAG TPA: ribonuclease P protein component [Acidimicrobiales bacterium]|nr:ribonuclease P protein component [Acidimicrobiales bacterium]